MQNKSPLLGTLFSHWEHRLTGLFTGIFLLQFVLWFQKEDYLWLPQTVRIVELTLLLSFLMELLPRRIKPMQRGLINFLLLIVFNAIAEGYHPVGGKMNSFADFLHVYYANVIQLHPFFWFSFGAWLSYMAAMWFFRVQWRTLVLLALGIIALAVRDSFSKLVLWDNVAVMIFSGLCLLIIQHFARIKRKSPSAWAYLTEYPVTASLPVVSILTVTMLLASLAPDMTNLLTDPYTLIQNWKGQPVFTSGKTIPGVTSTLGSSASGYGRGEDKLGDGFNFDYSPVMTVDATHRSYWRGETRSFYSGKGWEVTEADKKSVLTAVNPDAVLPQDKSLGNEKLKTVEVKQTVKLLNDDEKYPVLFGALSISKVENVNGEKAGFDTLSWSANRSELLWNNALVSRKSAYPQSYTLISSMPVVDEDGLRTAPAEAANKTALKPYLQLPDSLPPRVKQLALDLTADQTNPYDKVKKLEAYLKSTYPYTNKPDLSKAGSKDFVDRFLFEIRQGYCDYYSTALAVMTRAIGIPSRWVKGYAPGTPATVDGVPLDSIESIGGAAALQDLDPDAANVFTVRNSDAHSWVEVYFNEWGWVPFEPTSGFILPRVNVAGETVPETSEGSDPAVSAEPVVMNKLLTVRNGVLAGMLLVILFFLLWRFEVLQKLKLPKWQHLLPRRRFKTYSLSQRVVLEFTRFLRFSNKKGYRISENETAREAILRLSRKDAWLKKDLETLLALFEKAKYSSNPVTEEEYNQASRIVIKLRQQM